MSKTLTKGGKRKKHSKLRDTCIICGGTHTVSEHRHHGKGSFRRTHR